jgi:ABC-type branched-subunit amino acid transport system ATPase component
MELFAHAHEQRMKNAAHLAAQMRPHTLDEFVGQEHIIAIILWGPQGTGKTTLAMVIANQTQSHFETLSAVLAGKADLKEAIDAALERRRLYQTKSIVFAKRVLTTLNWMQQKTGGCIIFCMSWKILLLEVLSCPQISKNRSSAAASALEKKSSKSPTKAATHCLASLRLNRFLAAPTASKSAHWMRCTTLAPAPITKPT